MLPFFRFYLSSNHLASCYCTESTSYHWLRLEWLWFKPVKWRAANGANGSTHHFRFFTHTWASSAHRETRWFVERPAPTKWCKASSGSKSDFCWSGNGITKRCAFEAPLHGFLHSSLGKEMKSNDIESNEIDVAQSLHNTATWRQMWIVDTLARWVAPHVWQGVQGLVHLLGVKKFGLGSQEHWRGLGGSRNLVTRTGMRSIDTSNMKRSKKST